ncbi:MAG: hypothetical protein ABIG40_00850 [Parcubacteria group bacterium]
MEKKIIKISDMRQSPIRHAVLPNRFIERVRAFKQVLGDVENTSPEEAIRNFMRDLHPERELIIWEHIAAVYQKFITENTITDVATKKEVYGVALSTSMGMTDFRDMKLLNQEQIKTIVFLYRV